MKKNKFGYLSFIIGIVMFITGLLLWKDFSFIICGLGIVLIGISLILKINTMGIKK